MTRKGERVGKKYRERRGVSTRRCPTGNLLFFAPAVAEPAPLLSKPRALTPVFPPESLQAPPNANTKKEHWKCELKKTVKKMLEQHTQARRGSKVIACKDINGRNQETRLSKVEQKQKHS